MSARHLNAPIVQAHRWHMEALELRSQVDGVEAILADVESGDEYPISAIDRIREVLGMERVGL